jgi:hypothetical protein
VNDCAAVKQVARQTTSMANRRVFMAAESIGGMLGKVERGGRFPGSISVTALLRHVANRAMALPLAADGTPGLGAKAM